MLKFRSIYLNIGNTQIITIDRMKVYRIDSSGY